MYSTLDLAGAFTRFPIYPKDQHKTAFTSVDGTRYMFRGCPFGLKLISSKFQRVMGILFRNLTFVTTFVDDIIVFSKTVEEHAEHVRIVIDRLTAANLILQAKKCFFLQKCVYLLGFCISAKGISPDQRKVLNAQEWPVPRTSKDIQAYLGLINYFRAHIPKISDIAASLDELRNCPNVPAVWSQVHQTASDKLKYALLHAPILSFTDMG